MTDGAGVLVRGCSVQTALPCCRRGLLDSPGFGCLSPSGTPSSSVAQMEDGGSEGL